MGKTAAAAGGFVLGSIVTAALTYVLFIKRRPSHRKQLRHPSAYAEISAISRVGFLTDLIVQLWSYLSVAGGAAIIETVEPMFAEMGVAPLSSCRFTKVDLGKTPLKVDNVVVHELDNDEGMLQFDLDITWDASDCEISLKADYVGTFGIRRILLEGRMSILMKPLSHTLPVVSGVQYAFINPPTLELDFTGLASVADVGFIEEKIADIMQDTLKGMMVLPNRMLYKMDPATSFFDTYQPPLGMARITLVKGRGFQVEQKAFGRHDVPDVYCNISLGDKVWRTKTIKDNLEPEWNEFSDFLLCDLDQIITLQAFDEDQGPLDADDDLGSASLTVGEIILAGKTIEVELLRTENNDKGTGAFVTLHCQVCELTSNNLDSFKSQTGENQICGLLTIVVTKAFDIPLERKQAACFVKIACGDFKFVTSAVVDAPGYDALNPAYDCVFYVPLNASMLANKDDDGVVLELIQGVDTFLGSLMITHASVMATPEKQITDTRKIGDKGASLEFRVAMHGVKIEKPRKQSLLRNSSSRTDDTDIDVRTSAVTSNLKSSAAKIGIGTVRVTAVKGHGFKATKKLFKQDIPDVYCKIKFGSSPHVWRTATIKNSLEPEWNEWNDYVLTDHSQMISIDVYDENRRSDDQEIGRVKIPVGKLLLKGRTVELQLQKDGKGTAAFISFRCEMV